MRTLEIIFDIIETRLCSLSETHESHNKRTAIILGFDAVILSIVFPVYSTAKPVIWLFILGIVLVLISLLLSVIAIKSGQWREDPYPRGLRDGYIKKEYRRVLEQVISNLVECYDHNLRIIRKKARTVDWGFYCVFAGLFFLTLSIL